MVQTLKSRLIPWQVLKRLEDDRGVPVNGHGVAWADVVEQSEGELKEDASPHALSNVFSRLKTRSEAKDLVEQINRRVQERRKGTGQKASGSQCASVPTIHRNLDAPGCLVCGGEHDFDSSDGTLFAVLEFLRIKSTVF